MKPLRVLYLHMIGTVRWRLAQPVRGDPGVSAPAPSQPLFVTQRGSVTASSRGSARSSRRAASASSTTRATATTAAARWLVLLRELAYLPATMPRCGARDGAGARST